MPKTRINCPNCRQPIMAEIDQLFDVGVDPTAKQKLLSGSANLVQCPLCGYQGNLSTMIVYHDPSKELLLTFVPPEIGLPRNEQERLTGALINQVINNLPQEKRKAYLLQPQSALTFQGLVERVLEADGITREMIQAQQQRLNLIQRFMSASDSGARSEIAKQEDNLIDEDFFTLLRRLIDVASMGGDETAAQQLSGLQEELLPITTYGKKLQAQSEDIQAVVKDLQAIGKDLNREKLLDLVVKATNETRLRALVSFTRPVMDYSFFQLLSERIERARGDGRNRLIELRESLLEMTRQIDEQVAAHVQQVRANLKTIIQSENLNEAMGQYLPLVDDYFLQELNKEMDSARKSGDLEKLSKLQNILDIIESANESPPELSLIEDLLEVPADDKQTETWRRMLSDHQEEITSDFLNTLSSITAQVNSSDDREMAERLTELHRLVLRFSMERNLG